MSIWGTTQRVVCKWFGHKWATAKDGRRRCTRCGLTGLLA